MILLRPADARPAVAALIDYTMPDLDPAHRDAILDTIGRAQAPLLSGRILDWIFGFAWGFGCFAILAAIL